MSRRRTSGAGRTYVSGSAAFVWEDKLLAELHSGRVAYTTHKPDATAGGSPQRAKGKPSPFIFVPGQMVRK